MAYSLQFNKAATDLIKGREGSKLRFDVRDGSMFIRPTDRKAGPHVLSEYQAGSRGGVMVSLDDKQAEKLAQNYDDKTQFTVVKDKYGWFALRADGEGDAQVTIKHAKADGSESSDDE